MTALPLPNRPHLRRTDPRRPPRERIDRQRAERQGSDRLLIQPKGHQPMPTRYWPSAATGSHLGMATGAFG